MSSQWIGSPQRTIKKELLKLLTKKARAVENIATQNVQNSIEEMDIIDTKFLKSNSKAKVFTTSDSIIISHRTEKNYYPDNPQVTTTTTGILAIKGEGNHRKFGKRNYLRLAAKKTLKILTDKN